MKTIALTQGQIAIVDDEDFERVNQFKWSAQKIVQKKKTVYYAKRTVWTDWKQGKQQTILLHRFILDAEQGLDVDHRNLQTLDCRRQNLRVATRSQNRMNTGARNKLKGVSVLPSGRYAATICINGKQHRLGAFDTAEMAAMAYDTRAKELFGEFALFNFPEQQV